MTENEAGESVFAFEFMSTIRTIRSSAHVSDERFASPTKPHFEFVYPLSKRNIGLD